jgi:preprotein translocase subunit SecA
MAKRAAGAPAGGSAMSDAEKEFLEQAVSEKEFVERLAQAQRMVQAVMDELHQKYEGNEEKSRREFMRRFKEDAALQEAALMCASDDVWRELHPFEQQ